MQKAHLYEAVFLVNQRIDAGRFQCGKRISERREAARFERQERSAGEPS